MSSTVSPFRGDPSGAANRGDRGSAERRGGQGHKGIERVCLVVRVAVRGVQSCYLARLLAENVQFRPFLGVKPKLPRSDLSILVGLPDSATTPVCDPAWRASFL